MFNNPLLAAFTVVIWIFVGAGYVLYYTAIVIISLIQFLNEKINEYIDKKTKKVTKK